MRRHVSGTSPLFADHTVRLRGRRKNTLAAGPAVTIVPKYDRGPRTIVIAQLHRETLAWAISIFTSGLVLAVIAHAVYIWEPAQYGPPMVVGQDCRAPCLPIVRSSRSATALHSTRGCYDGQRVPGPRCFQARFYIGSWRLLSAKSRTSVWPPGLDQLGRVIDQSLAVLQESFCIPANKLHLMPAALPVHCADVLDGMCFGHLC
jgi:hypothetical protein